MTHCKCLAAIWSVLLLCPHLEGCQFILKINHHELRWFLNLADATGKLARWQLRLLEYVFEVVHRGGVKHQEADALPRLLTTEVDNTELEDEISVMMLTGMKSHNENKSAVPNRTEKKKVTIKNRQESVTELPTISEFFIALSRTAFCKQSRHLVGTPGSAFAIDRNGVLVG